MQTVVDKKTIRRLFRAMESKGIVLLREVLLNQNAPGVGSIAIIGSLVSPTGERYDEHTVLQQIDTYIYNLVGHNQRIRNTYHRAKPIDIPDNFELVLDDDSDSDGHHEKSKKRKSHTKTLAAFARFRFQQDATSEEKELLAPINALDSNADLVVNINA
jgi:hypothetical protein